jgi:hypothetical protein
MPLNIEDIRGSGASARSYLWEITIDKHGMEPIANQRCMTTNIPMPVPQKIETNIRGFTIPESGAADWNPITFTLVEVETYDILNKLWEWSVAAFNPEDGVQNVEDASPTGTGEIKILMQGLSRSPVVTYSLNGCIISGITPPDPGSDKAATLDPSFEVSYAYATK